MGTASAATLKVAADGSENFSSIQGALSAAVDGDVIEVGPGTYTGLIETQGLGVHIRSTEGAESTILDGGGGTTVFLFGAGDGADTVIEGFALVNPGGRGVVSVDASPTLIDLDFQGLGSSELNGGAVSIQRGNPSFEGCSFKANIAELGGAIHAEEASLSLVSCAFEENQAEYGGAVWAKDVTWVDEGSTYDFNVAAFRGGAIHMEAPFDGQFSEGRFWSNESGEYAGAVWAQYDPGSLVFTNVEFTTNTTYGSGGAIFAEWFYGPLRFEGCHFDANDGVYDSGAAIYTRYFTDLSIVDSVVENHIGYYRGGAVYHYYAGDFRCKDSLFEDNHSGYAGGGVMVQDLYSYGEVEVSNCQFISNTAAYEGGGFYAEDVDVLLIEDSLFQGNTGGQDSPGGGLALFRTDTTLLRNNAFVDNRAGFGGAMNLQEADPTIGPHLLENNLFVENVARLGGALLLTESPRARGEMAYGSYWSNLPTSVNRFYLLEDPSAPEGDWSLAADWDFTQVEESDGYVVFYPPILELPEVMPTALRLQVYNPHLDWTFAGRLVDGSGETFYGYFGGLESTGWQEVVIPDVASWSSWGGNDDDIFDLPITQITLQVNASQGTSGTVLFDDVRVDTEASGEVFLTGWEQSKWPLSIQNNSFVANHALEDGGAVLGWDVASDFRNNLIVSTGGGQSLSLIDEQSLGDWQLSYNGFYSNVDGDHAEGMDNASGVYGDPGFAHYSQDGELEGDRFVFLQGSPYVDAGDPTILDPDASRSDLGANGGPNAIWVDEDGDGFTTGVDCDDSDATVFPGAEEQFYDGINQDCSLGSDFDADGDGEDAEEYGGADCDDQDPERQLDCGAKDSGEPDTEDPEGSCACSTRSRRGTAPVWLLGLLFLGRRRRA
jgi:predicted outer membrane repeat protein